MTCAELRELYEFYALGLLDQDEKTELERHLEEGCPTCAPGVREAAVWSSSLASLPEPLEPPRRLRKRVLASIGAEPASQRAFWGAWAFATACLAVTAIFFALQVRRQASELQLARAEVTKTQAEAGKSNRALAFLNAPETEEVGTAAQPRLRAFVNPRRGVLLLASHLPPAPEGKAYEMWVLPKKGAPAPAGVFQSDANGNAVHLLEQTVDRSSIAGIAVTLEPASGSPAPTTTPIVAAMSD